MSAIWPRTPISAASFSSACPGKPVFRQEDAQDQDSRLFAGGSDELIEPGVDRFEIGALFMADLADRRHPLFDLNQHLQIAGRFGPRRDSIDHDWNYPTTLRKILADEVG
jgi:hypothetical protein